MSATDSLPPEAIDGFISRWESSGGHERGAGHQFLLEFLTLLDLPHLAPPEAANEQKEIALDTGKPAAKAVATATKLKWPKSLSAQVTEIRKLLPTHGPDPEALSAAFGRKSKKRITEIQEILHTLTDLGKL